MTDIALGRVAFDAARGRRLLALTLQGLPWALLLVVAGVMGGWVQGGDGDVYRAVAWPPDYSASSVLTPTYNYSPAFALLVQPLQALSAQAFTTLILVAEIASLAYLVTPWIALLLIAVQTPLIFPELLEANLNLVAAALVVMGLRSSWAWAPLLLTKVTPGVGLVWFAVRREWRMLGLALGITALVALPSFLAPGSWMDWFGALTANNGRVHTFLPPSVRLVVGAVVVAYAAHRDWRWLVPLGVALAYPVPGFGWVAVLGMWRLSRR